jgi:hypothetical protein
MFIDIADDKGRSRKRKRTEKKKPSTLVLVPYTLFFVLI